MTPHLFDCKPRLTSFFSSFSAACNQGWLTFFFFSFSKGIDDGLSFLGYVLSTKPSFCLSVLFSLTCTLRYRRDCDEQKAVVVV